MSSSLFVLLGAGASFDASTYYRARDLPLVIQTERDPRPPLVKELFDTRFDAILKRYPMALNAAPDIRDAIAEGSEEGAVSLEDHLRQRYRDSTDELDRRRFYSLPLYLQDVLWSVSGEGVPQADNLDRLVNSLLASFEHVCFMTLNFDMLLDRTLAAIAPLPSISSYISQERWSLLKLHGSVTWGYRMHDVAGLNLDDPPANLDERIDRTKIFHSWVTDREHLRQKTRANETFNSYPALSVPLGSEDELVCPPEHQEFLTEMLQQQTAGADMLVVGYSAFDDAVIGVIKSAGVELRSLAVVNADRMTASDVALRLTEKIGIGSFTKILVAEATFGEWARAGLRGYPEWVRTLELPAGNRAGLKTITSEAGTGSLGEPRG